MLMENSCQTQFYFCFGFDIVKFVVQSFRSLWSIEAEIFKKTGPQLKPKPKISEANKFWVKHINKSENSIFCESQFFVLLKIL